VVAGVQWRRIGEICHENDEV
jgi:hypothetical protein